MLLIPDAADAPGNAASPQAAAAASAAADCRDLAAPNGFGPAVLAAALALPGLVPAAQAQGMPEQAVLGVRWLDYRDRQPGLDRIGVRSPAVSLLLPLAGDWTIEGSVVADRVSGASPRYHTAISGASRMEDRRHGADARVTRYFSGGGSVSAGVAHSDENDYRSLAFSLAGSLASEDRNTTATLGAAVANDTIDPVNQAVRGERRHVVQWLAGVTRVLTPRDIVQANFTRSLGDGYYSDPYKFLDRRPRSRGQSTVLLRWNHHFGDGSTLRASWRRYRDSWGIRALTLGAEWVRPLGDWTLVPAMRVYSQAPARFYSDAVYDARFGPPFPPGYNFADRRPISADQRLSGFGARSVSLRIDRKLTPALSADIKLEAYRQRSGWRLSGAGSPGLAPLDARSVQVGLEYRW